MLYAFTLGFIALVGHAMAGDACTGNLTTDMNRVEYQIPMNPGALRMDTKAALWAFLDHLDETLEDVTFVDQFDILKKSAEWYVRRDRTKMYKNLNMAGNGAPRDVSLKYRQTRDVPECNDKYQNDLSFQFQYGTGEQCAMVMPGAMYAHVFEEKVESNMGVDPCVVDPMMDGQAWTGIGYTGKLEFDDDPMYGTNSSNAMRMFTSAQWDAWPMDCMASGFDDYFDGKCDWFMNPADWEMTLDKDVFNLVLDVDFELTKDKDMDGDLETISEGTLTFQVRYETWADYEAQVPNPKETEMSVKLKKKDTDKGYWDESVSLTNAIINQLVGCGSPWIRYADCEYADVQKSDCASKRPTMAPTHSPNYMPMMCCSAKGDRRRWKRNCPMEMTEDDCGKSRKYRRNCQWSYCMEE